jgi:hypothetical protein
MILVAFILYDVYAVYATLFPQVLKMHGSCLPTQLFVLLLNASESSEKEASKLRDAKSCREKSDVRGGPPSLDEDAGDMPSIGELCDGEVCGSVWYPFVVAIKYVYIHMYMICIYIYVYDMYIYIYV